MRKECNRGNMRKFIEALECGQYEQGSGRLRQGDRFCCLGVACDLAMKNGVEMKIRKDAPAVSCGNPQCTACGDEGQTWVYEYDMGYLPVAVQEWLGIDTQNPILSGCTATWWNDHEKASFTSIGQLFRHEYLDENNPSELAAFV